MCAPCTLSYLATNVLLTCSGNAARVSVSAPHKLAVYLLEEATRRNLHEWVKTFVSFHPGGLLTLMHNSNLDVILGSNTGSTTVCKNEDNHWIVRMARERNTYGIHYSVCDLHSNQHLSLHMSTAICEGLKNRMCYVSGVPMGKLNLDLSFVDRLLHDRNSLLINDRWLNFMDEIHQRLDIYNKMADFGISLEAVFCGECGVSPGPTLPIALSRLKAATTRPRCHLIVNHATFNSCTVPLVENVLPCIHGSSLIGLFIEGVGWESISSILKVCSQSCHSVKEVRLNVAYSVLRVHTMSPVGKNSTSSSANTAQNLSMFPQLSHLCVCFTKCHPLDPIAFLDSITSPLCSIELCNFQLTIFLEEFSSFLSQQRHSLKQLLVKGINVAFSISKNYDVLCQKLKKNFALCTAVTVLSLENVLVGNLHGHFPLLFQAVSTLPNLAVFRWRESNGGNMFANSLVSIKHSWESGFHCLESCWIVLKTTKILIDMTKVDDPSLGEIADLLSEVIGDRYPDETIQTLRVPFGCGSIAHWLQRLKPHVQMSTVVP